MSRVPRLLPLVAIAIGGVVAVRALGAAPDLFQGARAWAEEATAESEAGAEAGEGERATPPPVCAVSAEELAEAAGLSPAELRILQSLSQRRGELDARDVDFETQMPLLIAAEAKVDEKITALTALRGEIEGLLGQVDEREQAEINRLVQVYQSMRPREAARVFAQLPDDVRLPVAAAMRPRALAAIMAQMEPAAARTLTERLAERFQTAELNARVEAAADDDPATDPGVRPTETAEATPPPQPRPRPTTRRPTRRPPATETAETPTPAPAPTETVDAPAPAPVETPADPPRVGVS